MAKWYNPLDWFRYIPHPHYGNYGGGRNKCDESCPTPVDWADEKFQAHDSNLKKAKAEKRWYKRLMKKYSADRKLGRELWKGRIKNAKSGRGKLFETTYIMASRLIFFRL